MLTAQNIVLLVLIVVFSVQVLTAQGCMFSIAKCEFQGSISTCTNWTMDTAKTGYDQNSLVMFPGGYMVSNSICGFNGNSEAGCLSFHHNYFYGTGLTLTVKVMPFASSDISFVKNVTSGGIAGWNSSKIDITRSSVRSNADFYIHISVTGSSSGRLFIDNLQFVRSPCSSFVAPPLPPSLVPTSSTTKSTQVTTSDASSTPTTTSLQANTTLSVPLPTTTITAAGSDSTTVPTTTSTNPVTASPASSSLSPSSSSDTPAASPSTASSSSVGTIVGAVVAVIVLIAVIVIVCIVLARRRGKDFWKTWLNKENRESTQKPDIRMNGMPSAKVLNENDQPLRPNGEIGSMNTAQPSSENYYSVIHHSDGSFSTSGQALPQVNQAPNGHNTINPDLPPSNLAPGFEYNHLDFGNRPATKTGSKPAANQNYSHINTSDKSSGDGAYSLAQNPAQQNSATRNESNYQEALKATGVYHILDSEPGNRESATSNDIYHVPDDGDNTNPSDDPRSSSVYHDPGDVSKPGRSHNANSIYYNPDDPKYSTQLASAGVYHTLESDPEGQRSSTGIYHVPDETASKPQPPRKPVGVYEMATNPAGAPKKPTSPPKPNNVYHVLEPETKSVLSPKGVANSNYEIAEPSDVSSSGQASHSSVYHLANASGFSGPQKSNTSSAKTGSNEGDYNSLDLSGKKLSKTSTSDADTGAVYSHLNEAGEDTYNEMNRGRKTEVIDDEYSHLGKQ